MKADIKENDLGRVDETKNDSVFVIYRVSKISLKYTMEFMSFQARIKSVCGEYCLFFAGFFLDEARKFSE